MRKVQQVISAAHATAEILEERRMFAAFPVITNADSGPGSLRQAITDANNAAGADVISFAIGTGPQTIILNDRLPELLDTAGVTIDGTTQPGFVAGDSGTGPIVTIDCTLNDLDGLQISGGNSTVRGLNFTNVRRSGIRIQTFGNNTIAGNTFTSNRGLAPGIHIGSSNNTIGGPALEDRNVIGTFGQGVEVALGVTGNMIRGNYIGTDSAGRAPRPNTDGVNIIEATATQIIDNLIAGNSRFGISLSGGATGTVIQGNRIGTDAAGTGALGNGSHGIVFQDVAGPDPLQNEIGGTDAGEGNVIAFNGGVGVQMDGGGRNAVLGNSISGNESLGIKLAFQRTENDNGDADAGANGTQNYPVLTTATATTAPDRLTVTGLLNSTPLTTFRVEFFATVAATAAQAEGQLLLGNTTVQTDQSGNAAISLDLPAVPAGRFITATATDSNGNTSEFSDPVVVVTPAPDIEVSGNGVAIVLGDSTPAVADFTDFGTDEAGGSVVTRTFIVSNTGQTALDLVSGDGVTITGAGASQFTVTPEPLGALAPGQTANFALQFNPSAAGVFNATVNIASNDPDENPYTFAITGQGVAPPVADLPPTATLLRAGTPAARASTNDLVVRYSDNLGLASATFATGDIIVTGPAGFSEVAQLVAVDTSGTQADATYRVSAPGGIFDASDNGTYSVSLQPGEVSDTGGNVAAGGTLGSFTVALVDDPPPPPPPPPPSPRTLIGEFGSVAAGRARKLVFNDADNTVVTIALSGGSAQAYQTASGVELEVATAGGKLTVATKGGNGRVILGDVSVIGSLKSFVAKSGDLVGALSATQGLSSVTLGSTSGATISTPSPIASLNIAGAMTSTQVFSGANLGADGRFGGTGADADGGFGAGSIGKLNVGGTITGSVIAAGLDPADGELLNGNGVIVGGIASRIRSIRVRGAVDSSTVFAAGAFPRSVKLGPQTVNPAADPRFEIDPESLETISPPQSRISPGLPGELSLPTLPSL